MKCRQKIWLLRADPKDKNTVLGMNLHVHTIDEKQKEMLVKEGIPLWMLASGVHESRKMDRVQVKWVYTFECVDAEQINMDIGLASTQKNVNKLNVKILIRNEFVSMINDVDLKKENVDHILSNILKTLMTALVHRGIIKNWDHMITRKNDKFALKNAFECTILWETTQHEKDNLKMEIQ